MEHFRSPEVVEVSEQKSLEMDKDMQLDVDDGELVVEEVEIKNGENGGNKEKEAGYMDEGELVEEEKEEKDLEIGTISDTATSDSAEVRNENLLSSQEMLSIIQDR